MMCISRVGMKGKRGSFKKISRGWFLGGCLVDALRHGRWEDVEDLTRRYGLDPNVLLPEYGVSPMHIAAGVSPEEFGARCVAALINAGGDPNVKCSEGVTPVHVASCWGRASVLEILLNGGGDPYSHDDEGNDAFYYAKNKAGVMQVLSKTRNKSDCLTTTNRCKTRLSEIEDLDLNPKALSLMINHRQSVHIFESFPEDDSASSATLEDPTEDFTYEPDEDSSLGNIYGIAEGRSETYWSSDNEIRTENILEADKTQVIQTISKNADKCKGDVSESPSDTTVDLTCVAPCTALSDLRPAYELKSYTSDINRNCKDLKDVPTYQGGEGSCNVLDIRTAKTKSGSSSSRQKSKSSTSLGSISEYKTPMESKDVDRKWSEESCLSCRELPHKTRERLECFKTNTHYRTKTRVLKLMVSKSCEGIRKSLYLSGYEFWSSKVRCKSYPTTSYRRSKNSTQSSFTSLHKSASRQSYK